MVYSFSVIRIRSASICYGFVRLYEKSKAKSMVRLVARRGGVHLNRFTSKLKSSYRYLFFQTDLELLVGGFDVVEIGQ